MRTNTMWLGDSDCGEGPPERSIKNPCPGPDCPCVPMKQPGYPAKQRSPKKDFCVKCPPKKPCNLNKCPPDTDGTCGNVKPQEGDLLKLHSDSQAVLVRGVKTRYAARTLDGSVWNGNHGHHQEKFRSQVPRRFFSSCDGSGEPPKKPSPCGKTTPPSETSPKKSSTKPTSSREPECNKLSTKPSKASVGCEDTSKKPQTQEIKCPQKPKPPEPPSPPIASKCKASKSPESSIEPKVLYRKCPPPPKLPKLPKCPKPPEIKAQESCIQASAPKCPPPPTLPKCPECPSQPTQSTKKDSSASPCRKVESPPDTKVCSSKKEKIKGIWERLRECKTRKMSTYVRSSQFLDITNVSLIKNQTRDLGTSYTLMACFSSKSDSPPPLPPWKPSKCKTIEEVCSEQIDKKVKALECKPMDCPKDPNAKCYPDRPRCAAVRTPVDTKVSKSKKKSGSNDTKMGDCGATVIAKTVEKIDYTKIKCEPPKFTKLGPCPPSSPSFDQSKNQGRSQSDDIKPPLIPLPKPPSAPVVFCRCPPPPKLHPGSCPCYVEVENLQLKPRTEPCSAKAQYSCPEIRIYYCKLKKNACEKDKCEEKNEKMKTKP